MLFFKIYFNILYINRIMFFFSFNSFFKVIKTRLELILSLETFVINSRPLSYYPNSYDIREKKLNIFLKLT